MRKTATVEVDPMLCPKCGGAMTDFSVVDRIIGHLKLTFVAERPPPAEVAYLELLMAAMARQPFGPALTRLAAWRRT